LPLEDPAADEVIAFLPQAERLASWHLARPGGRFSSRGAAGIDLLDALGFSSLSRAAVHASGPIERLYDVVAERRDKLGRFVPEGPAPRRFP
jgi:hypothetical protein